MMKACHTYDPGITPLLKLTGASREQRRFCTAALVRCLDEKGVRTLVVQRRCGKGNDCPDTAVSIQDCGDVFFTRGPVSPRLAEDYDLLLEVDNDSGETADMEIRPGQGAEVAWRHRPGDDVARLAAKIYLLLEQGLQASPVWGCLLIGGLSSRMGRPKHLLETGDGLTWAERICARLAARTSQVVLAGRGDVPAALAHLPRLADIAGARGPLAGILAAMRWNPRVSWLVCACDMPLLQLQGLSWLLGQRKPGVWGSVPRHPGSNRLEPLLAHYDRRSRHLLEEMAERGEMRIREICTHDRIATPVVPQALALSWKNCNTPDDLADLSR